MKVRLIIDCEGPNPKFDPKQPVDEETNPYDIPRPTGTVIEDPMAWILCLPDQHTKDKDGKLLDPGVVRAEPIDDEAKAKVAAFKKRTDRQRAIVAAAKDTEETL